MAEEDKGILGRDGGYQGGILSFVVARRFDAIRCGVYLLFMTPF